MLAQVCRYVVRVAAGIAAAGFIFVAMASAQTPKSVIEKFLANPAGLLQQYPNGGSDFISVIRDVAVAHPEALKTITGLLTGANSDQQLAIGSGLGLANRLMARSDQAYANQIAVAVADSGSGDAQAGFSGATGNVAISSTGPGGGAGGGGGGGSGGSTGTSGFAFGGSNSGSGQSSGDQQHFQTSTQTFTGGGGGVSGSSSSGSVSPR